MPPGKPETVGGGNSTGVANDWADALQGFLATGQMGGSPNNSNDRQAKFDAYRQMLDRYNGSAASGTEKRLLGDQLRAIEGQYGWNPNMSSLPSGNPSGGMGTPGANPDGGQGQVNQFFDFINKAFAADPNNANYSNPNNPRPDDMIQQLAGMQFDPMQFATPGVGRSDMYNDVAAMMQAAGMNAFNMAGNFNPTQMFPGPDSLSFSAFSSDGLLGDRGNVTNAITNAANTARGDALAAANERFTAMGGLGGNSTSNAFERAITNARGDEALASALAEADLGYRNLDLNAYNSLNNALLGNRNIDAYIHGNMLNAANQGMGNIASLLNTGGSMINNLLGREYDFANMENKNQIDTNKLNLDSALGFNELNSKNLTNATNMAGQVWNNQASMDIAERQRQQQAQQSAFQQMMAALMQQAGLGTPQANTVIPPNPLGETVKAIAPILPWNMGGGK